MKCLLMQKVLNLESLLRKLMKTFQRLKVKQRKQKQLYVIAKNTIITSHTNTFSVLFFIFIEESTLLLVHTVCVHHNHIMTFYETSNVLPVCVLINSHVAEIILDCLIVQNILSFFVENN